MRFVSRIDGRIAALPLLGAICGLFRDRRAWNELKEGEMDRVGWFARGVAVGTLSRSTLRSFFKRFFNSRRRSFSLTPSTREMRSWRTIWSLYWIRVGSSSPHSQQRWRRSLSSGSCSSCMCSLWASSCKNTTPQSRQTNDWCASDRRFGNVFLARAGRPLPNAAAAAVIFCKWSFSLAVLLDRLKTILSANDCTRQYIATASTLLSVIRTPIIRKAAPEAFRTARVISCFHQTKIITTTQQI